MADDDHAVANAVLALTAMLAERLGIEALANELVDLGETTDDPDALFQACGWTVEHYPFDRVGEQFGRGWTSSVRPMEL